MRSTSFLWLFLVLSGCSTEGIARRSAGPDEPRHGSAVPDPDTPGSVSREGVLLPDEGPVLYDLDLQRALAVAEEIHPDLAAARARVEAAGGRALQAGLYPNPVGILRTESAPISDRTTNDTAYLAGVSFPLEVGGRISTARRAEEVERESAMEDAEATRREVRSKVQAAFAAALYAERAFEVQDAAREMSESGVAITRALVSSGEAIAEDLARAELDLVQVRHDMRRARSLRGLAVARLAAAMGHPTVRIESMDGSLEAAIELPSLESISSRLDEHPAVRAADAMAKAQRIRIALAEAERIPRVNLDLLYRRVEYFEEDTFDVGVNIPLPIFDRNQGQIQEARAEGDAAEAKARSVRNDMVERLSIAHATLSRALSSAAVLREEVLPRAGTLLGAQEVRYAAGEVRLADVLAVRREHLKARLSYLEALRDSLEAWAVLSAFLEG